MSTSPRTLAHVSSIPPSASASISPQSSITIHRLKTPPTPPDLTLHNCGCLLKRQRPLPHKRPLLSHQRNPPLRASPSSPLFGIVSRSSFILSLAAPPWLHLSLPHPMPLPLLSSWKAASTTCIPFHSAIPPRHSTRFPLVNRSPLIFYPRPKLRAPSPVREKAKRRGSVIPTPMEEANARASSPRPTLKGPPPSRWLRPGREYL